MTRHPANYPLPVDPVTGFAWWEINLSTISMFGESWQKYQKGKSMEELIPILRWLIKS